MKIYFAGVLTFLLCSAFFKGNHSGNTLEYKIHSPVLQQDIQYTVYLPDAYYNSSDSFPVIYLLHGFGGDHTSWLLRCNIDEVLDSLIEHQIIEPAIVIMPDGKNSYFMNDYAGAYNFEDAFVHDFLPAIEKDYRILAQKKTRAIGGLSMGGFGAISLCMSFPDQFGSCMTYGAAARTDSTFAHISDKKYATNFASLYGDSLSGTERLTPHWMHYSPFHRINDSLAIQLKTIHWYINCGFHDFLYPGNEALHDIFNEFKIIHEYHVEDGNHSWNYWRRNICEGLIFINTCFQD